MGKIFINHCALHPCGGHQPPKSDKPKTRNPPKGSCVAMPNDPNTPEELNELAKNINDNGLYNTITTISMTTSLELKIRKEVMTELDELLQTHKDLNLNSVKLYSIKDRLTLLWCDNDV